MSKFFGRDERGTFWEGEKSGNTIKWEGSNGKKGTETVRDNGDGTMTGTSATGQVVPVNYDGEKWSGGNCIPGEYVEKKK
jgi:hypothetical protein